MNKAQEYGRKIAEKIEELQEAFRAELNPHNDIYASYKDEGVYEDSIAAELAENEDFIMEYLHDQVMELAKAVLIADWHGLYVAGWVPAAKSYAEYREREAEQTTAYYNAVNKELDEHYAKLAAYYASQAK